MRASVTTGALMSHDEIEAHWRRSRLKSKYSCFPTQSGAAAVSPGLLAPIVALLVAWRFAWH